MKLTRYEQETIINFNAQDQMATLYTRDPAVMRKVDALVIDYPDVFKCIGETDIDKPYEMPKSVVTYRKPRIISDERRSQLQKIIRSMNPFIRTSLYDKYFMLIQYAFFSLPEMGKKGTTSRKLDKKMILTNF